MALWFETLWFDLPRFCRYLDSNSYACDDGFFCFDVLTAAVTPTATSNAMAAPIIYKAKQ